MFKDKLRRVMFDLCISQTDFSKITGCSRSAVSQYLSGKNIPPKRKRDKIAESLGLGCGYFDDDEEDPLPKSTIPRLSVTEAANMLGIHNTTLRMGLRQGVFPWGYAIQTSEDRWVYFINARRFAEIEKVGDEEWP